jgi:Cu2+-exporting ATPase
VTGAGVECRYGSRLIRLGHGAFCGMADPGAEDVYLAVDGTVCARLRVADPLRADAADAVAGLKRMGLDVTLVSGDAAERCAELARTLAIGFVARQSPETKVALTRTLQKQGRRVLVLGDGINDIPALAAADVSAAVLEASSLVKSRADVLLLSRRLGAVVDLVDISRRARRVIRQNLGWALSYNLTAIPLAALGLMPPWLAALGMAGSSVLVMANASRLLRAPRGRPGESGGRAASLAPTAGS